MQTHIKIKRISILSAVKIGSIVSFIIGLILGMSWAVIMVFFSSMIGMMMSRPASGLGISALFFVPITFSVLYTIIGASLSYLLALLYNIAAGLFGGVEMEIEMENTAEGKNDTFDIYGVY